MSNLVIENSNNALATLDGRLDGIIDELVLASPKVAITYRTENGRGFKTQRPGSEMANALSAETPEEAFEQSFGTAKKVQFVRPLAAGRVSGNVTGRDLMSRLNG